MLTLHSHSCLQLVPHAMLRGSTSLRKIALELTALQLGQTAQQTVNARLAVQCFSAGTPCTLGIVTHVKLASEH